ncbi:MAG: pilus assembly protein TadE [Rhizobiaceae bacterium]|jgi:Flp pilus assembly protein TadG|nr:pilus assembly protein TadE [Rhizobiaceae bacterium]
MSMKLEKKGARLRNSWVRFLGDRRGNALEFLALALPFSFLVFAILESCISFAGQEVMANATEDVARKLRTGQIRAADIDEVKLKQLICNEMAIIVANECPGLLVDLREFPSFAAAAAVKIKFTPAKDIDTTGFAVDPGPSMSRNMLRVFYKWPVMTDFMRTMMSSLPDGKTLLFASVTWQNEPFDD